MTNMQQMRSSRRLIELISTSNVKANDFVLVKTEYSFECLLSLKMPLNDTQHYVI